MHKIFDEYCDHLEHEATDLMHNAMQAETMHIDEIMIIGELIDQIKNLYKLDCLEDQLEEMEEEDRKNGTWDGK